MPGSHSEASKRFRIWKFLIINTLKKKNRKKTQETRLDYVEIWSKFKTVKIVVVGVCKGTKKSAEDFARFVTESPLIIKWLKW